MKNTLTRSMETSNVTVMKNCSVRKEDSRITNCQANLNTQPAEPKLPDKPEDITERSTHKWGE